MSDKTQRMVTLENCGTHPILLRGEGDVVHKIPDLQLCQMDPKNGTNKVQIPESDWKKIQTNPLVQGMLKSQPPRLRVG